MTEENGIESAPFDAELEIIKLQGRFRWLVNELEEFRQKDRSLSARISRLKMSVLEGEDLEERLPEEDLPRDRPDLDAMTVEERAILATKLLDRLEELEAAR